MDQNNIKHGLINSNGSIDIVNDVVNTNKNEKKKAARKRWAILAKALKSPSGSEPSSPTDEFSVRRISSFMLLTTQLLENAHLVRDPFIADRIRKRTWADYWKSQERKYCNFCNCWIADNKPSIEFHEKGRRHKENVSKRLRSIQKQSRREERESIKVGSALQRMETAALEAYRKDVEANADLTSLAINKKVKDDNLLINSAKKLWHEAKSPTGQTYYWNILTNESVWKPPSEGYLSIIEQKETTLDTTRKQLKAIQKHELVQERVRSQEEKQQEEEERARLAREKMKERRVEDLPTVTPGPIISAEKPSPYGQWKTVKISEHIDLQLPHQAEPEPFIPEPKPEPVVREFKEKVIETLGTSNVGFKKRKIGSGAKYNARKRLDDE